MLKQRVISALVFVPLMLGAFLFGGVYFAGFTVLAATLAAGEFRRMVGVLPPVFVAVCALVALSGCTGRESGLLVTGLFGALILFVWGLFGRDVTSTLYGLAGTVYIGGFLGAFALLRFGHEGKAWSLFTLLTTWATDTGAYFGGTTFGKRRIAPAISPKKSWEGAFSGLVAAGLVAWGLGHSYGVPAGGAVAAGVSVGVWAQAGDLTESLLKRFCKIKDSGNTIPGHGGVLDRFDSLLFAGAWALILRTVLNFLE